MTQSGGASIGAASFSIGLDLQQFQRDLDAAEALARTRAQRIQGVLGAIPLAQPVAWGAVAAVGSATSHPVRLPAPRQGAAVPAYVQEMFRQATAGGMPDQDARRSIARTLGLNVNDLAGLGGSSAGPRVSATQAAGSFRREMLAQQQRAQRDARLAGRSFSVVRTGQAVQPSEGSSGGGPLGFLGLGGSQGILRTVGALTGVGLGLNVAALAASRLHEAFVGSVEAAVQLERAARNIGVAFGPSGAQFTGAGSAAFAQNAGTRGTTQQFLGAVAGLAPIAAQYGLTKDQVQSLVVSEGQLARIHGVELPQAAQVLQSVLQGNLAAGQALDLQLTDEYGILRNVGLTWDELIQAQGRARAEQTLLAAVQADVNRQLTNAAATSDASTQALDRLGKAWDNLRNKVATAPGTTGAISIAGGALAIAAGTEAPPGAVGAPGYRVPSSAPGVATGTDAALGPAPGTRVFYAAQGAGIAAGPQPTPDQIAQAIAAQNAQRFEAESAGQPLIRFGPQEVSPGAQREQRRRDAEEQANRAGIQSRMAQAQLDTLGAQSDLRRLGVQGQLNDLARVRLDIEGQLAPVMLEQQQVQDRITLSTREDLSIKEQVLRAQQAAIAPVGAAQDLSYAQQRVRILAQIQQSRAIRGLGPAPGIPDIPTLYGQAYDLALGAPEVALKALDAQHSVDVVQRAQQRSQTSKQINAIPDEKRLQQIQDIVIPYHQAEAAAKAAADAIERSLQGADLTAGPARIEAERRLAEARMQQADAAGKIAAAQAETNPAINANATVTIAGLTDVQEATRLILEAFYPVIINAINTAVNNPRPPAGPPTDRGGN